MTDTTNASSPAVAETLLEFPAELSIKAMGLNDDSFEQRISDLVNPHLVDDQDMRISSVSSSGGKYLSVRVHLTVQSHAQMLSIYQSLRDDPAVLFTL